MPWFWQRRHTSAHVGIKRDDEDEGHRRQGIGRELLTSLLAEARQCGIHDVWGSVVDRDLSESPFLLDFYQRHSFELRDPDPK